MISIRVVLIIGIVTRMLGAQDVMTIIKSGDLSSAQVALSVVDLSKDIRLYDHNADVLMIPASSLKVITTFSALELLGADYRYETQLGYRGSLLSDGTLLGDIVIRGSGDPSLASPKEEVLSLVDLMADISSAIRAAGIHCIAGSVVVDGTLFEAEGIHDTWPWDDLTNYYASGAYGFNFHENYYDLHFSTSAKSGELSEIIGMNPMIPFDRFENLVHSGPKDSGDNAYIYGDPYSYDRYVKGTLPPAKDTFTIHGAIPNPDITFAQLLIGALEKEGINVDQIPSHKTKLISLKTYKSPQLNKLVQRANYESNNTYCEAFLKTMGLNQKGSLVTYDDGVHEVYHLLETLGLDKRGLNMQDGSGLSTKNRVSAHFFTDFLSAMIERESIEYICSYLPRIGQEDTTLERFMLASESMGNVWLKSGSMAGVLSYTGLIHTKSGQWLAISIMSNGHRVANNKIRLLFGQAINKIYLDH